MRSSGLLVVKNHLPQSLEELPAEPLLTEEEHLGPRGGWGSILQDLILPKVMVGDGKRVACQRVYFRNLIVLICFDDFAYAWWIFANSAYVSQSSLDKQDEFDGHPWHELWHGLGDVCSDSTLLLHVCRQVTSWGLGTPESRIIAQLCTCTSTNPTQFLQNNKKQHLCTVTHLHWRFIICKNCHMTIQDPLGLSHGWPRGNPLVYQLELRSSDVFQIRGLKGLPLHGSVPGSQKEVHESWWCNVAGDVIEEPCLWTTSVEGQNPGWVLFFA